MLEASPARLPYPLFALLRVARAKIFQGTFSTAMIVFPQQPAENTSGVKIGLDIEQVKKNNKDP
jgi:hypothetical protein